MTDRNPDSIQQVHDSAREQAKDIDEFAVCCSDGKFEFARTSAVAMDILNEMQAARESRRPDLDFEYDVIVLTTDEEAR